MRVLALDTASARESIALLEDGDVAAELRLHSRETHSALLLSGIDYLLGRAGWKLDGIGLVVACAGPGSFTGIRIGVATASGLAQSLRVPFACVSGLDALAHQAQARDGRIGIAIDAQRAQVYYAEYDSCRGRVRKSARPLLLYPDQLRHRLRKGRRCLAGDGALRYARQLGLTRSGWPRLVDVDLYLAGALGRLAMTRKRSWRTADSPGIQPLYIRPPDALRPGLRK